MAELRVAVVHEEPEGVLVAECWVRKPRADCLDRILILGHRHLVGVRVRRLHWRADPTQRPSGCEVQATYSIRRVASEMKKKT
jgi:hypothetical protein